MFNRAADVVRTPAQRNTNVFPVIVFAYGGVPLAPPLYCLFAPGYSAMSFESPACELCLTGVSPPSPPYPYKRLGNFGHRLQRCTTILIAVVVAPIKSPSETGPIFEPRG